MARRRMVLAFVLASAGLVPAAAAQQAAPQTEQAPRPPESPGPGQVSLEEVKRHLAERNYYPSLEGLRDAQADVTCNILDQVVAAFPDAAGKPIRVRYYWSRPSLEVGPHKKFVVTGIPESLTDLASRAQRIFQGKEDLVINAPVYETIETTEATATRRDDQVTVTGVARDPSDQIKKLSVAIDGATWQVRKMELDLGGTRVALRMTSTDLGGKWGVASTVVSSSQTRQIMKFEYTQAGGFWLPSRISIEYAGPDGKEVSPAFVYEFSDWQVNAGIPEGVL